MAQVATLAMQAWPTTGPSPIFPLFFTATCKIPLGRPTLHFPVAQALPAHFKNLKILFLIQKPVAFECKYLQIYKPKSNETNCRGKQISQVIDTFETYQLPADEKSSSSRSSGVTTVKKQLGSERISLGASSHISSALSLGISGTRLF
jgi:hypothetical protein